MKIVAKTKIDVVESIGWYIPDEDREFNDIEVHIDTYARTIRIIADHPKEGVGPVNLCWDMDYFSALEDILVLVSQGRVEGVAYKETNRILC